MEFTIYQRNRSTGSGNAGGSEFILEITSTQSGELWAQPGPQVSPSSSTSSTPERVRVNLSNSLRSDLARLVGGESGS